MNTTKNTTITIPRSTVRKLEKMAQEENISKNKLIQKALRKYKETRQWKSYQSLLSSRAKSAGIRTEDDIESLIDDIRQ